MKTLILLSAIMFNCFKICYAQPGKLDSSFGTNGIVTDSVVSPYRSIAIQKDGKIIVVGSTFNGKDYDFAAVRYNADGSLDNSFGNDGKQTTDFDANNDAAGSVAIQSDGKIVAAGGSNNNFALVRYNVDGSPDNSFSNDGKQITDFGASESATSLAIQADGKIVLVGSTVWQNPGEQSTSDFVLARYNADGSLDESFSNDGKQTTDFGSSDQANSVAIQNDKKIIVVGWTTNLESGTRFFIVRYNEDGSNDNTFNDDGIQTTQFGSSNFNFAYSVATQTDGKIVVVGNTFDFDQSLFAIARYNIDGSLDNTFDEDGLQTTNFGFTQVTALSTAVQSDGKIVVGGEVNTTVSDNIGLSRYNTDGSLDISFGSGGKLIVDLSSGPDVIFKIAISNNKLYTAGNKSNLGFVARFFLDDENNGPTVTITSPANNTSYVALADIPLVAEATDPDGIRKIQFFNGTTLLATQNFFPYKYTWHNRPAGDYTFTAQLTNNKGVVATSDIVHVTVSPNKPPIVSITSPANNAIYVAPAAIRLVADAKDTDGTIKKVQFYNGTTLIATQNYFPYALTWYPVPTGDYAITAKAIDDKGAVTTSEVVQVTVVAPNNSLVNAEKIGNGSNAKLFAKGSLSLKAGPDPANDILNIYTTGFEQNKKLTLSVVAVSGVVIKTIHTTSNQIMQLDVSSLRPGIYFLKVGSGDKILYTRFVKL